MDFLDPIDALIIPSVYCIYVLDGQCQCTVPIKWSIGKGLLTLRTLQVKKEEGDKNHVLPERIQTLNTLKEPVPRELLGKVPLGR